MTRPPYLRARGRRTATALVSLVALGLAAAAVRRSRHRPIVMRVKVDGVSMIPALAPGDRVVAVSWPRLEPGDLVVATDPEAPGRVLVKRVARLRAETVELAGDNAGASRDSRHFGPVSRRNVLGRVLWRYHPADAVGLLRRPRPPRAGTIGADAGDSAGTSAAIGRQRR